jgi:hypothetical protein
MAKKRPGIPQKVASFVLISNRQSCCVCQKFQVQLHHIDENPENNSPDNLAVLCLSHHDLASMKIGLSKKLRPEDIRRYKKEWEAKCAADVEALARDRLRFYATVYKNPPRIRGLFAGLSQDRRLRAVGRLVSELEEDARHHKEDQGFKWQALPGDNDLTRDLLFSLRAGDMWPKVLPRVEGHPRDPDYPIDFRPPYGMTVFHGFDLYCQLMVRTLAISNPPRALEYLWTLQDPKLIDHFAGSLISFRELAIGKGIVTPRIADEHPLGSVQFRVQRSGRVYRALMMIKNMYVFSDTAVENLKRSKVTGLGVLEGASIRKTRSKRELHVSLKPLIIGIGGFGQSLEGGLWDFNKASVGDRSNL